MRIFRRSLNSDPDPADRVSAEQIRKVIIYESELDRVTKLTLQYPDLETGGSLFGYWSHTGSPIVAFACGPGVGSRRNRSSFYQSEEFLFNMGTGLYDRHGMQHIGEWHSHHQLGLNEPSGGDVSTVVSGMRQKGWPRFLLLITTIADEHSSHVLQNYFLFAGDSPSIDPLRILPLPGKSPYRGENSDAGEEPISKSVVDAHWDPGPFTPTDPKRSVRIAHPTAWFAQEDMRWKLGDIARRFHAAGVECRIVAKTEADVVQVEIGDDMLVLRADFSETGPEIHGSELKSPEPSWSPDDDVVEWYLRIKKSDSDRITDNKIDNENSRKVNEPDNTT